MANIKDVKSNLSSKKYQEYNIKNNTSIKHT